MFKFLLLICLCLTFVSINCQIDVSFCDYTQIVPNNRTIPDSKNPFKILPTTGAYQYKYEKNRLSSNETEEISAYLDLNDDIAVSHQRVGLVQIRTYSYYKNNEILVVRGLDKACGAQKLTDLYSISPFYIGTKPDGSLKIKTPLQYLLEQSPYDIKNTLDGVVRGLPVTRWKTCGYIADQRKTLDITISFSSEDWNPAFFAAGTQVPVGIIIRSKTQGSDKIDETLYAITEFRKFNPIEIPEFFTEEGVYCQGRTNLKKLPKLVDNFDFKAEIKQFIPGTDGLVGFLNETREIYDYDEQIFRTDNSVYNSLVTEIHDFNTGLNFRIDKKSGNCSIQKIDGSREDAEVDENGYVIMRNPKHFFDFSTHNYQFTGKQLKSGALVDVWIGVKNYSGVPIAYEWYFLDEGWTNADSSKNYTVPIQANIYVPSFDPRTNITSFTKQTYSFTDFQETKIAILDHDISNCGSGINKQIFEFKISTHLDRNLIKNRLVAFLRFLVKEIKAKLRVTQIRIVNPLVTFPSGIDDDVIVYFELFDKIGFYGNVELPKHDEANKDAIGHLQKAIDNSNFRFNVTLEDDSVYEFVAKPQTLFELRIESDVAGTSAAAGAITAIIMIIIGVGISVGLLYLHKSNKIKLPFI